MNANEQTIQQQCESLAKELYARMHTPGQKGQHWDSSDDAREVSAISDKIVAIARDAYIKGSNDIHEIFKSYR